MELFLADTVVLVVIYMVSFHGWILNHAVITMRLIVSTITFLPCIYRVLEQWMYHFSCFFDHAKRSHVSFLTFWAFFLTWLISCFYMGVFFLHWMFIM